MTTPAHPPASSHADAIAARIALRQIHTEITGATILSPKVALDRLLIAVTAFLLAHPKEDEDVHLAEMITWARAGQPKPLLIFVEVARQAGATHRLTFEAFHELVPDLDLAEFDALIDDEAEAKS